MKKAYFQTLNAAMIVMEAAMVRNWQASLEKIPKGYRVKWQPYERKNCPC